mgnify:CR=1 FL=1
MNYRMIAYSVGRILVAVAATMLAPLGLSLFYGESIALAYVIPIVISILIGLCVSAKAPKNKSLYGRDGMFIVAIGWIVISIIGCLPFYISGQIPSFVDSFFETVSGFTTTGSSILTNVEALDKSLLFWRSFTHWLGGMGVLAFAMAIFSSKDTRTTHMMRAEMPGPVVGKLASRWQFSLRILYGIYIALTVIEFVLLLFGGMPVFDSLLHTFGTAGTGGFGIKNSSVAYYNSAYIDYVIGIFMMLFGLNFNVYFLIIARKFSQIKSNDEVKWYIGMMIGAAVIIALNIMPMYQEFRATIYSDKFPCIGDLIYEMRFSGQSKDHLSLNEKVKTIQYWDGKSLRGALMDRDNPVEYMMLKKKREHINSLIATRVEMMYMWDFIEDFVKRHSFQRVDFDVFAREFKDQFNVNIDSLLDRYYDDNQLPILFVQDLKMESYNDIPLGYCKVYNPSDVDGVLKVDGYDQKLRRQRPNYFLIPAKSCKEVRVRNYTIPSFSVELGLCCNLPDRISIMYNDTEKTEWDWEGIRDADSSSFRLSPNEIVVDNEDVGFRLVGKDKRKKWGEHLQEEREYQSVEDVGDEWILSISSSLYGYKIKSAYCKKAGIGEEYAEWIVKIKEPGKYRVVAHVPESLYATFLGSFLKNARLYYQVFSEEGDTYVELDLNEETPGWIELGTYEFREGDYFVQLSDKGGTDLQPVIKTRMLRRNTNVTCYQIIIADAVKWVKVE